jgi:hypothetical protein
MPKLKHPAIIIVMMIILQNKAFTQRIVENRLINDVDDYNLSDTAIIKHNLHTIDLYSCTGSDTTKLNACILYAEQRYDSSGRLIELIKGENIKQNKIDFTVHYRKINDSLFESIATYLPTSSLIAGYYIDTAINGESKKISLYKRDKNNNLVMRSLYKIKKDEQVDYINRYDIDGNLVEVYYPFGRRMIKKEWTDTVRNKYQKITDHYVMYKENNYEERTVTNNDNKVVEFTYSNVSFLDGYKDIQRSVTIYNEQNNPVIKETFDENNKFLSEEKYYYNGDIMVRYTEDENLQDSILNEEKIADERGRIIISRSHPSDSNKTTTWKYYFYPIGLNEKNEYYVNDKIVATRIFRYK